jgi:hypothetical protein
VLPSDCNVPASSVNICYLIYRLVLFCLALDS